jgi:hypothetical protein
VYKDAKNLILLSRKDSNALKSLECPFNVCNFLAIMIEKQINIS